MCDGLDGREEPEVKDRPRQLVAESLADPRPDMAARDVFQRLRAYHAERAKEKFGPA
jgi:hypothetical protein